MRAEGGTGHECDCIREMEVKNGESRRDVEIKNQLFGFTGLDEVFGCLRQPDNRIFFSSLVVVLREKNILWTSIASIIKIFCILVK